MSDYIKRLLVDKKGGIEDSLYRAKSAANHCDASKEWGASGETEWGASGETLQSIIDGYQRQLDECNRELKAYAEGRL